MTISSLFYFVCGGGGVSSVSVSFLCFRNSCHLLVIIRYVEWCTSCPVLCVVSSFLLLPAAAAASFLALMIVTMKLPLLLFFFIIVFHVSSSFVKIFY